MFYRLHFPRSLAAALLSSAMLIGLSSAALAQSNEVDFGGAKFPTTVKLHGTDLALNGGGVRYKAIFKVYAVALYTAKPCKTYQECMAVPGPKRVTMQFLRDNLNAKEFGQMMTKGIEANVDRNSFTKSIPGMMKLGEYFAKYKRLTSFDLVNIDYIPNTGTVLTIKGDVQEAIKEPEFYDTILSIWLGKSPVDGRLKEALLIGANGKMPK